MAGGPPSDDGPRYEVPLLVDDAPQRRTAPPRRSTALIVAGLTIAVGGTVAWSMVAGDNSTDATPATTDPAYQLESLISTPPPVTAWVPTDENGVSGVFTITTRDGDESVNGAVTAGARSLASFDAIRIGQPVSAVWYFRSSEGETMSYRVTSNDRGNATPRADRSGNATELRLADGAVTVAPAQTGSLADASHQFLFRRASMPLASSAAALLGPIRHDSIYQVVAAPEGRWRADVVVDGQLAGGTRAQVKLTVADERWLWFLNDVESDPTRTFDVLIDDEGRVALAQTAIEGIGDIAVVYDWSHPPNSPSG